MPTNVVFENDEEMNSVEKYIDLGEKISRELEKVDLVDRSSVTRPIGEPLEDFFVAKQAETLKKDLVKERKAQSKSVMA